MRSDQKFWLVWGESARHVSYKHEDQYAALNEAKRLQRTGGGVFYVMEATLRVSAPEPTPPDPEVVTLVDYPF